MRTLYLTRLLLILGWAVPVASAENTLEPLGYSNGFGADGSEVIFNHFGTGVPGRFQQVSSGPGWSFAVGGVPIRITSVAFRPDDRFIPPLGLDYRNPVTFDSLKIQLSTTSKAVDSLSPTFADNIGPDVVTVFDGSFTMSYPFTTPHVFFGSPIVFSQPFYFDPSKGNLLFDITKVGDGRLGYNLDAVRSTSDTSSSVGRVGGLEPTGGVQSLALIMQFTYVQVPEPSAFALMCLAAVGAVLILPRRGRATGRAG